MERTFNIPEEHMSEFNRLMDYRSMCAREASIAQQYYLDNLEHFGINNPHTISFKAASLKSQDRWKLANIDVEKFIEQYATNVEFKFK